MTLPHDAPADLVVQAPEIATPQLKELAKLTGASRIEALQGAATQAFRLLLPTELTGVAAYCAAAQFDFGLVPRDQTLARACLVAMDMDSTLITIECIDEIADMIGIKPQVAAITASTMRGEIDFRESLTRRVALLRGLEIDALQRVYDERLRLSPGAERMLDAFKRAGATTLLVSGGFTFFTERLKARLSFDHALANTLEVADGKLSGRIQGEIIDAQAKAAEFVRLAEELAGVDGITVAIGDGANDLPLLSAAQLSVAYRAKPVVRGRADYAIDYCGLDAILNLFR
jgi:phosphoserine phosphatase